MRTELMDDELNNVAGGKAYVNANTMKVAFSSTMQAFQLKNCRAIDAVMLCDSLIGTTPTDADYDQACIKALQEKGWI